MTKNITSMPLLGAALALSAMQSPEVYKPRQSPRMRNYSNQRVLDNKPNTRRSKAKAARKARKITRRNCK